MTARLLACVCGVSLSARAATAAVSLVRQEVAATVAARPAFLASADFNGDARADIAVSSPQSNEVTVLLGQPDGTLQVGAVYRFGRLLSALAAGDLNRDGIADLAVGDQRAAGVHVLLGAGNGTFGPPALHPIGDSIVAVAIADFDQANGNDLALADRAAGRVALLLNDGNADFGSGGGYVVGQGPDEILAVDVNRDGRPDLLTLNQGGARVKDVAVLLYRRTVAGLPLFESLANFGVGEEPSHLVATDLDGDGAVDLAMLNRRTGQGTGEISFLRGDGSGFFVQREPLPVPCPTSSGIPGCPPLALVAADFDVDGAIDLAVTQADPQNLTRSGLLALFLGAGDGTFTAGPAYRTDPVATTLLGADVTGDGRLDLAVGSSRRSTVRTYRNAPITGDADRLPGQVCDSSTQCVTVLCIDAVCCRSECLAGERCDLASQEGMCALEDANRPRGAPCESREQCQSSFCVDDVCCIAGVCPGGARCDIPATEGVCRAGLALGQPCDRAVHCRSQHCAGGLCCDQECAGGSCDVPGSEGQCVIPRDNGQPCSLNRECTSDVCDAAGICCAAVCLAPAICFDGLGCATPTPTLPPSPTPTSTALPPPCRGDCNGNGMVGIDELILGVNIALGLEAISQCRTFDDDRNGAVSIDELIAAVRAALDGCRA